MAAALAGGILGYLSTLPQTPVFQARVSLEIQAVNENFLNMRDVNPNTGTYTPESDIQTQVRILQSPSLLDRVADKLNPGGPIAAPPQSPHRGSRWIKALSVLNLEPPASRPKLVEMAAESLRVRALPSTRLIEAYVGCPDPRLAADFANALADGYIEQKLETRWQSTPHTGEWLTRQMRELKAKLEKSEDQLRSYAHSSGPQFTSEKDVLEGEVAPTATGIVARAGRTHREAIAVRAGLHLVRRTRWRRCSTAAP